MILPAAYFRTGGSRSRGILEAQDKSAERSGAFASSTLTKRDAVSSLAHRLSEALVARTKLSSAILRQDFE